MVDDGVLGTLFLMSSPLEKNRLKPIKTTNRFKYSTPAATRGLVLPMLQCTESQAKGKHQKAVMTRVHLRPCGAMRRWMGVGRACMLKGNCGIYLW